MADIGGATALALRVFLCALLTGTLFVIWRGLALFPEGQTVAARFDWIAICIERFELERTCQRI